MTYNNALPIGRIDAEKAYSSNDSLTICQTLIRVILHNPDWRFVQEQCIRFADHIDSDVRGLAATCFGHLARIHRQIDKELLIPVFRKLQSDSSVEVRARAEDAIDDLQIYLKWTKTEERMFIKEINE